MPKEKADEPNLEVSGTIVAMTSISISPNRVPEGPWFAMKKVFKMADIKVDDVDLIEINEAFIAVPLVSLTC